MTNKHVLWIGIDPNILLEGLDTAALFKCENYLKFNINSAREKEIVESKNQKLIINDAAVTEDEKHAKNYLPLAPDEKSPKNVESSQTANDDSLAVVKKLSLSCPICDKVFAKRKRLTNHHRQTHTIQIEKSCEFCPEKFATKARLMGHVHRNHIESKLLQCKSCRKIFEKPTTFGAHNPDGRCERNIKAKMERRRLARRSVSVLCNDCGKTFRKHKLKPHIRFVHEMINFPCDLCEIKLQSEAKLLEHKEFKHEGKGPKCNHCSYVARYKKGLQKHIATIHENAGGLSERFPCTLQDCDKTYSNPVGLSRHMQFHKGEKPFTCDECGKSFIQNGTLKEHLRVHTGERPFQCLTCGKAFSQASGLKGHQEQHNSNGEKRFKCFPCQKAFRQASALRFHEQHHNKEKVFRCSPCNKGFTQASSLRFHQNKKHPIKQNV